MRSERRDASDNDVGRVLYAEEKDRRFAVRVAFADTP
jgi:hypothetical protein